MRVHVRTTPLLTLLLVFASTASVAANRGLPRCDTRVVTRHGSNISIGLDALNQSLNRKLSAAHSDFSEVQLASEDGNLKVSGKKKGTPVSIIGPLQVTGNGLLRLHANKIQKNGDGVEGMMNLFGKNLSDYLSLKKTKSMRVQGDDLIIYPDKLLGLHGRATGVKVLKSRIDLQFASQPCR